MRPGLVHHRPADAAPERVVVLGAGGFIGRHVVERLRSTQVPFLAPPRTTLDLAAPGAGGTLASLMRPTDTLLFLAALTPDRGRDTATAMANLRMGEAVSEALAAVAVAHVIYTGSDAVYPFGDAPVDETTQAAPGDLYGAMHVVRELMLEQVAGDRLAILRPTMVHGPDDTHDAYGPNRFRREAARDGRITLAGAGEETRDHVHVRDVAHVVERVLRQRSTGLLNLVTGVSHSFAEIARLVAAQHTPPAPIVHGPPTRPVTHRRFDARRHREAFPDFAYRPLAAGIAADHARTKEAA